MSAGRFSTCSVPISVKIYENAVKFAPTFAALENAPAGGFRRFRAEMTSAWLPVDSKLKPQVLTQGGWGGPQRQALCPLNWSFSLQDKPWPSMPCSFGNWQTASQIQPRSVIN